MPYEKKSDLPKTLRETMPEEAQDVYIQAYNEAFEQYQERQGGDAGQDAVAHRNAMHTVNQEFAHDPETGKWYRKGEGPQEEEQKEGLLERIEERIEDLI
ncbi:MAG: ChaB family protein [Anaerolineae bacterium]|jgi:cation transport regulator